MNALSSIPARSGPRPKTRGPAPHEQITQNASPVLQEKLLARILALPGIKGGRSGISVPGARAFLVDRDLACGPSDAYMIGNEFGHLHPPYDGSLHLRLPETVAQTVIAQGWAEEHPLTRLMFTGAPVLLVYGPRTEEELEVVQRIVQAAYAYASTQSLDGA